MPIVAFFSGAYSSAAEIAEKVADRLGYSVVSNDVVQAAACKFGVPENKINLAMSGSRGWLNALTREWEKNLIYIKAALAELLKTDDRIFIGPATYLIPQPITHVLRVRIVAEQAYRIQKAIERDGMSAEEAASSVAKSDRELSKWTSQILPCVSWDPFFYDMTVPIPAMSVPQAVDVVCENVVKDTFKPTEASIRAVEDFALATSVSVALSEVGRLLCDVTANDGEVTVVVDTGATPKGALARTVRSLRFEDIEEEIRGICATIDQVKRVEVRPGAGAAKSWEEALDEPDRGPGPVTPSDRDGAEPEGERERPLRLLLADDDVELLEHLGKRLRARGLSVTEVTNGEDAIESATNQTFDVAVLDINMPGVDGVETLRQLKRIQPFLQVIMLTGYGSVESAFESGQLDAVRFLQKPHKFEKLLEDISQAGQRKASAQRAAYERELSALVAHNVNTRDVVEATERLKKKYDL